MHPQSSLWDRYGQRRSPSQTRRDTPTRAGLSTAGALAKECLALGRQRLHQGIVGIDKLLHSLVLELPGDAMEVNAYALEIP
jgi:hypothetical protein